MKNHIVNSIKDCAIFSELELDVCEKIAELFQHIELPQNEILFEQGQVSDFFYILITGTLIATVSNPGGSKFVGTIECGETVGELGAISGQPRALTVKAAQPCKLIRLSSEEFKKLCHQYPSLLMETIKPIISRSQKNIRLLASESECDYVVVMLPENHMHAEQIKRNFLKNLPKEADYLVISEFTEKTKNFIKNIHEYEKKYSSILFLMKQEETSITKFILERAVTFYLFVNGDAYFQEIPLYPLSILKNEIYRKKIKFELVLYHDNNISMPKNTNSWIKKEIFFQFHHIKIDENKDYQRLLRFFSGNAIGVVFGGGGARGWMLLGILKALKEHQIPIDAIGGTSIGSLVAGAYQMACGNLEKLFEFANYFMTEAGPPYRPMDFTLPIISIFSAERVTKSLDYIFGNQMIEDLWLPYFCITTNLNTSKEQSHHSGLIQDKIRGSIAIPGIFPPKVMNGHMHFDGGVCNNLPVNVMKNVIGPCGKVIAIGLTSIHDQDKEYDFPSVLRFQDIAKNKFRFGKPEYDFPPFFDTFYRVLMVGSFMKERENSMFADIFVNPNLSAYRILNLTHTQKEELFKTGQQEMIQSLSSWKYDQSIGKLIKY
jgi:NTE family protein